MGGIYQPDNSQLSQQYGVSPFQKVHIRLDTIDRTNGQLQPSLSGEYVYVEKTDYPFLISLVTQDTLEPRCVVARPGLMIRGQFKQMWITHPLLTPSNSNQLGASLIIGFGRDSVSNGFAFPVHQGFMPIVSSANSAVAFEGFLHIPKGSRFLQDIEIGMIATTITSALFTLVGAPTGGNDISPTLVEGNLNFATPVFTNLYPDLITIPGGFKLRQSNVPLPDDCRAIQFIIAGTGMSGAMTDKMVKASVA